MRQHLIETITNNTNTIQRDLIFSGLKRLDELHVDYADELEMLYKDTELNYGLEENFVRVTYVFIINKLVDTLRLFNIEFECDHEPHILISSLLDIYDILESEHFIILLHENHYTDVSDIFSAALENSLVTHKFIILDNINFNNFNRYIFNTIYVDNTIDIIAIDNYKIKMQTVAKEKGLTLNYLEASIILEFRSRGLKDLIDALMEIDDLDKMTINKIIYIFKVLNGYLLGEEEYEALKLSKPIDRRPVEQQSYWDRVFNNLV